MRDDFKSKLAEKAPRPSHTDWLKLHDLYDSVVEALKGVKTGQFSLAQIHASLKSYDGYDYGYSALKELSKTVNG